MTPLENYLRELRDIRSLGAGVPETSYYPALSNLLNEVGKPLKPKVRCVTNLANRGAGLPDGGLFTADQFPKKSPEKPQEGQMPSRGAIEVKPAKDDAWVTAESAQVTRYWNKYRQVLVTNYRDFVLVGQDSEGKVVKLESFRLAADEKSFWIAAANPRALDQKVGTRFVEFIRRVMLHAAPLAAPEDVAWFLASYAREALGRVENTELPALSAVRQALEEALGLKFEGAKGEHFFRSSLVQTLFYGVFSAWVLWARKNPVGAIHESPLRRFEWRLASWYLRVPMITKLFSLIADPNQLENLNLIEVLDWTGQVLNRVDRASFFDRFQESHAVQYFYEPFLESFDPELRKQLGVWYTPPEIVKYMVERVDRVLRSELGVPLGLADKNVYVLDPCCGTGSYLVEVLDRIHRTLKERGEDALIASDLKEAAQNRVFGFEILPAPFVVSHLQLGLLLQNLGAPLGEARVGAIHESPLQKPGAHERVAVYLTNALTGWEPPKGPKTKLMFAEMEEERDAAEHVKREVPILVILGNPPYNSFAGIAAMEEERGLSDTYRATKLVARPQGQGLNNLFVRFFRMAERRIVEATGRGVVCLISDYSWLDGLSFTGMREKYLEAFDRVWIDCLNGDKYKTGKLTPAGEPDPSVFSTKLNPEGIQVGTAIALMVRRDVGAIHESPLQVRFRHLWGRTKRQQLLETAGHDGESLYEKIGSPLDLGLPFMPAQVASRYLSWPLLPDLFPVSFPGVKTSRDDMVVDIDRDRLTDRMAKYFDREIGHEEMRHICPAAMRNAGGFKAVATREYLIKRGFPPPHVVRVAKSRGLTDDEARALAMVRYCYRPFDVRWIYWEPETDLLDRNRAEYVPHVFEGNMWLEARQKQTMDRFDRGYVTRALSDNFGNGLSNFFPLYLSSEKAQAKLGSALAPRDPRVNLCEQSASYISGTGAATPELFYHTIAILHAPAYRAENSGALRQDWPRIPLPDSKELLRASAELGKKIAALLDTETDVGAIHESPLQKLGGPLASVGAIHELPLQNIGVFTLAEKPPLDESRDLALTAGWGHGGKGGVTMPGKGKIVERDYTPDDVGAIHESPLLGNCTCDVYLNDAACWKNIPLRVWEYTIGGYQVIKKWLSYREQKLLGRPLTKEEVRYVQEMARRIAAILLLEPALDENYRAVKDSAYAWPREGRGNS